MIERERESEKKVLKFLKVLINYKFFLTNFCLFINVQVNWLHVCTEREAFVLNLLFCVTK